MIMPSRKISEIIVTLKSLERDLSLCMRCGMCQSVCPLYRETRREPDVARGKIILVDALKNGVFEEIHGVLERLQRCLLCGACEANCPSGVKCLEIFIKARSILYAYEKLSLWERLFLRKILSAPERFHSVMNILALCQPLVFAGTDSDIGTVHARFPIAFFKNRHLMPLATTPFRDRISSLDIPAAVSHERVGIFVGCLIDRIFPSVAESMIEVLKIKKMGIFIPEDQVCCGIPAISLGDIDAFRSLIRQNVKAFSGKIDVLVTGCATCSMVIKKLWPLMVADESASVKESVYSLSGKLMDIVQFLATRFDFGESRRVSHAQRIKVTYHDPCHLKKSLGIWREPRGILKSLSGYEFVEMTESDSCCGFGGSFGLQYGDISESIGERKVTNIIQSGAEIVSTACPGCMLQIAGGLSKAGANVQVKHIVELFRGL